ncbi:MAG: helix-turn-helix transcriptional regulator [Bacteroidales bacterium]|nr:helix-turn-helix transcriptional regulator [Bacteroidales bacterium]
MKKVFDKLMIYDFSDAEIIQELCHNLKSIRLSCCFSQQELAEKCGVSVITIKRIESGKVSDITMGTLLKIMRISGTLEGVVDLLPELPASPYLINERTGKRVQRFSSKRMQV